MKCQVVSCAVVVCSKELDPQQHNICHRSDCAFGEQYMCVSPQNGGNEFWCQQSVCIHQTGRRVQFLSATPTHGRTRQGHQDSQFKLHALPDRQPVKLFQGRCDMITSTQTHRK